MEAFSFVQSWKRSQSSSLVGIAALTTMLAACGGSSPASPDDGGDDPSNGDDPPNTACAPSGSIDGWEFTRVALGTKPAMAVGADGVVHTAFMSEAMAGWVHYIKLSATREWIVGEGYFYGPIDIVLSDDGDPRVLYHDHTLEDLVLGVRTGSPFALQPMTNVGHDGWYATGVYGPDGTLHTVSYDPSGFDGQGMMYGGWDGSDWNIEVAAPGSFDYKGGTAIVYTPDGIHAAFWDSSARVGKIATRGGPDDWTVSTIEPLGGRSSVGRFPDMEVDPDGSTLHLVSMAQEASGDGVIRYAKGTVGSFEFQDLMPVTDFTLGFAGARDIATLDLDENGDPVVAVQTASELTVLRVGTQGVETLAQFQAQSGIQFGQQTEVVADGSGRVHVIWWQSGEDPGTVCYGQLAGG